MQFIQMFIFFQPQLKIVNETGKKKGFCARYGTFRFRQWEVTADNGKCKHASRVNCDIPSIYQLFSPLLVHKVFPTSTCSFKRRQITWPADNNCKRSVWSDEKMRVSLDLKYCSHFWWKWYGITWNLYRVTQCLQAQTFKNLLHISLYRDYWGFCVCESWVKCIFFRFSAFAQHTLPDRLNFFFK